MYAASPLLSHVAVELQHLAGACPVGHTIKCVLWCFTDVDDIRPFLHMYKFITAFIVVFVLILLLNEFCYLLAHETRDGVKDTLSIVIIVLLILVLL